MRTHKGTNRGGGVNITFSILQILFPGGGRMGMVAFGPGEGGFESAIELPKTG